MILINETEIIIEDITTDKIEIDSNKKVTIRNCKLENEEILYKSYNFRV